MSTCTPDAGRRRTVSIPHLVLGIIFLGIVAIRVIADATDKDLAGSAIGFPVVLIGAGVVGLIATVVNARRRSRADVPVDEPATEPATDTETEATTVLEENDR